MRVQAQNGHASAPWTVALTELPSSDEIRQAEAYEARGWVKLRRTPMSKGKDTYGQQLVYAQVTDAGRAALARG